VANGAPIFAVNIFSLRDGVSVEEFARFSASEDRPACLATPVVTSFDAYRVSAGDGPPRIMEIMGLTSYGDWTRLVGSLPALQPVLRRFAELVDIGTVSTLLVTPLDEHAGNPT